jgi:hypothetical protein
MQYFLKHGEGFQTFKWSMISEDYCNLPRKNNEQKETKIYGNYSGYLDIPNFLNF